MAIQNEILCHVAVMLNCKTNAYKYQFWFSVAEPIYFGCDGVENSTKKTDFCGVCGGDNSTCTDCQGNVKVDFVNNGTCGKI